MPDIDFSEMRKEMSALDEKREQSIALSREIIRVSKRIIYSVHRNELKEASKLMSEIKADVKKIRGVGDEGEGHFRTAMQEFVEAAALFGFVGDKKLPSRAELGVSSDHYILGICDLSGELVRRAVNSAIKGDFEESMRVKDFLESLYGELLKFDFRNGDIRRKFDGIKYDLQKLEDLAFDISRRK